MTYSFIVVYTIIMHVRDLLHNSTHSWVRDVTWSPINKRPTRLVATLKNEHATLGSSTDPHLDLDESFWRAADSVSLLKLFFFFRFLLTPSRFESSSTFLFLKKKFQTLKKNFPSLVKITPPREKSLLHSTAAPSQIENFRWYFPQTFPCNIFQQWAWQGM